MESDQQSVCGNNLNSNLSQANTNTTQLDNQSVSLSHSPVTTTTTATGTNATTQHAIGNINTTGIINTINPTTINKIKTQNQSQIPGISVQGLVQGSSTNTPDMSDEEEGMSSSDYISLRKRRKLNSIVPNPRKPRSADYICAHCAEVR